MIPAQTLHVLLGTVVALAYAAAVLSIGTLGLRGFIGREQNGAVLARVGPFGVLWLGFLMGQGILGFVWLGLALAGILHAALVGVVCAVGWALGLLTVLRSQRRHRVALAACLSVLRNRSWYRWVGLGVIAVAVSRALIALLPTSNDDALWVYLTVAKIIAFSHTVAFQPFATPHNALYPLQIEMHWAALFAISNETAVTVWDYLCALSAVGGVGLLAWCLTSSRRVALLAVLMMLSTPGFYNLMGSGKADNAAAQYGVAAFLWLVLYAILGQRAIVPAALHAGWAVAARYTNVILLPALMLFAVLSMRRPGKTSSEKIPWVSYAVAAAVAGAISVGPMLVKNWLLVGCPLAPQFGCQDTFWAAIFRNPRANISGIDLLLYPFVWTFGARADMLGNISPLFLGFLPFLLVYRHRPLVQTSLLAGFAGLVSATLWLLIEPFVLFTRWLLVPLSLLALPLSASVVAADHDIRHSRTLRWMVRSSIFLILLFLLFQSRAVVYAVRYAASIDTRAARYESVPRFGYDVPAWLNTHVEPGQRVALGGWRSHPYFLDSNHLLNSESSVELQSLWTRCRCRTPSAWTAEFWRFYVNAGFTYVIVPRESVAAALFAWSNDLGKERPEAVFVGRHDAVLRIGQS